MFLIHLFKKISRKKPGADGSQTKTEIYDEYYIDLFLRFLEHFILNGPDSKALDSVLSQLSDPNRKQPQDLDKAVIGM